MVIAPNVSKVEKGVRVILGAVLIAFGFFLTGYWRPISIGLGSFFLFTAWVGY